MQLLRGVPLLLPVLVEIEHPHLHQHDRAPFEPVMLATAEQVPTPHVHDDPPELLLPDLPVAVASGMLAGFVALTPAAACRSRR